MSGVWPLKLMPVDIALPVLDKAPFIWRSKMALLKILEYPHPFLRTVTKPVETIDDELRQLVADMAETMYAAPGVGLAAVQVGVDKSIVVIDESDPEAAEKNLKVLLNPQITKMEGEMLSEGEGCLSFPDLRGDVPRAQKVTVRFMDMDGNLVEVEAEDFAAVVLQHEIEHLSGKTFFDLLSPLKRDMYKKRLRKQAKMEKQNAS